MNRSIWMKTLSVVLVLAMAAVWLPLGIASAVDLSSDGGGGGTQPPLTWANPFTDVSVSDWFYNAVAYVSENSLLDGTSANMFSPNLLTSRGMIAAFLYNLDGRLDVTNLTNPFNDVAEGQPYADAAKWAEHYQIMMGDSSGAFRPNDTITRQETMTILYRYASMRGMDVSASVDLSNFSDMNSISAWALEAMQWAVAEGIIQGRTATTIAPQATFTRAEFALIIQRFIETADYNLTNYDFIIPVKHKATVPQGYIPIYTAEDLNSIRNDVIDVLDLWFDPAQAIIGKYILMNDIDLADWGDWEPIGNSYSSFFAGIFDGNGYAIKNMTVRGPNRYAGLFGNVNYAEVGDNKVPYWGEVTNLGMVDVHVETSAENLGYPDTTAGGIAGVVIGYVDNCYATGSVSADAGTDTYAGGIIGWGEVRNCYSACVVHSDYAAGGIAGNAFSVENCYNSGDVFGLSVAGGVAAHSNGSPIANCYNTGAVSGPSSEGGTRLGGIVGETQTSSNITDSYNLGDVTVLAGPAPDSETGNFAGGLVGFADSLPVNEPAGLSNCYNLGGVSAYEPINTYDGIIAGYANGLPFTNCYFPDSVTYGVNMVGEDVSFTNVKPLTQAQMRQRTSFIGFDFDDVWGIDAGINNGYPYLQSLRPIPNNAIDITDDFTDPYFRAAVYEVFGKSPRIYNTDVANITGLDVSSRNIRNLAGLEWFSGLTWLDCGGNRLASLPATLPSSLKSLQCNYNQLTSLPETLPSALTDLTCWNNLLTALPELPHNLKDLLCEGNPLTVLPMLPSGLTTLWCDDNKLTMLPTLPSGLTNLSCVGNKLTSLPVLPTSLTDLSCDNNPLKELPETLSSALSHLSCELNQLTSLPALPPSLTELYCGYNPLTSLPESLPSGLRALSCSYNQLSSLPTLPSSLEYLICTYNQLTSLPALPSSLTTLLCYDNQLEKLPTLPGSLTSLLCHNNRLTELDVTGIPLTELWCMYNNMNASSDVKGFTGVWSGNFIFYPQNTTYIIAVTARTGGTVSGGGTYFEGATVTLTATPNSNYTFDGWYVNEVRVSTNATYSFTADADRTLQARFTSTNVGVPTGGGGSASTTFTVTFNTNGGSAVPNQPVASGGKVTKPADPTRTDYIFEGWYTDVALTAPYDFNKEVTASFTLYAKWAETVPGITTPLAGPFIDVAAGDWFYNAVMYAFENDLMKGTSDNKFSPNDTMTRAMLVTVLYRLEGEPAITESNSFSDVPSGQWYTNAIIWANANNIVNGYTNGKFGLNDIATREQIVTILYRYAQYKGLDVSASADLSKYTDMKDISDWALQAMKWAVAVGIIEGRTPTTTVPNGYATRAEVAAIFQRYIEDFLSGGNESEE